MSSKADLPNVSIVEPAEVSLDIDRIFKDTGVVSFKEDSIKFIPDTADFYDNSAAKNKISEIAGFLNRNKEKNFVLAGSTATVGSDKTNKKLSLERARAVKTVLTDEFGIDGDRIKCIGLGCETDNRFRIPDIDENGELIEKYAKENRAVFLYEDK